MTTSNESRFQQVLAESMRKAQQVAEERKARETAERHTTMSPEEIAAEQKTERTKKRWAVALVVAGVAYAAVYFIAKYALLIALGAAIWACIIQFLLWLLRFGFDAADITWKQSFILGAVIIVLIRLLFYRTFTTK